MESRSRSFTVPLSWLVELDSQPAPGAIAQAFGDRYLCRHNPIFAKMRQSAIKEGFCFSSEDKPLWRDYNNFGLTTLHEILATRTVPYRDTANTIARLLAKNPGAAFAPRRHRPGLGA